MASKNLRQPGRTAYAGRHVCDSLEQCSLTLHRKLDTFWRPTVAHVPSAGQLTHAGVHEGESGRPLRPTAGTPRGCEPTAGSSSLRPCGLSTLAPSFSAVNRKKSLHSTLSVVSLAAKPCRGPQPSTGK